MKDEWKIKAHQMIHDTIGEDGLGDTVFVEFNIDVIAELWEEELMEYIKKEVEKYNVDVDVLKTDLVVYDVTSKRVIIK